MNKVINLLVMVVTLYLQLLAAFLTIIVRLAEMIAKTMKRPHEGGADLHKRRRKWTK
jgi:hypothetical protein